MMADGYNAKRSGERFQNSPSNPIQQLIAHKLSKYRNFLTKIDVGDNLPVENTINDQCHAFFCSQLLGL